MPDLEASCRLLDMHPMSQAALQCIPRVNKYVAYSDKEVYAALEDAGNPIIMSNVYIDGTNGATKGRSCRGPAASGMCVVHELANGAL